MLLSAVSFFYLASFSPFSAFSQYNKDQLTPARVDPSSSDLPCLVTHFNDLGGGRFADPRTGKSFRYDHLRKEASDPQPWSGRTRLLSKFQVSDSLRTVAPSLQTRVLLLNHWDRLWRLKPLPTPWTISSTAPAASLRPTEKADHSSSCA